MLFHNFAAFSLRRTWNELGGIRRKKFGHGSIPSVPTIRSQDCQTTTSHAANQFSNDLQWDPDPFSLQGTFKITDVVDALAPDYPSGPISAQWEMILQDTATH